MTPRPRRRVARGGVLVLGGGLAGAYVARELASSGATLVSPSDLTPPLRSSSPHVDLVLGWVVALDAERRLVEVESEAGRIGIAYVDLVIALGSSTWAVATPGPPWRAQGTRGIPHPTAADLALPCDARGRVQVDEDLRVVGAPHIWALGDSAAVTRALSLVSGRPA
jgi:NADH dehydrogenase FAD-containing subunit